MESMTDLQQHIRKRLTEIEDLDERKDAREILLEGLVPILNGWKTVSGFGKSNQTGNRDSK